MESQNVQVGKDLFQIIKSSHSKTILALKNGPNQVLMRVPVFRTQLSPKLREKQKPSSTIFEVTDNQALFYFWPGCPYIHKFYQIFPKLYTAQNPQKSIGLLFIGPKLHSSQYLVSYWIHISSPLMLIRSSLLDFLVSLVRTRCLQSCQGAVSGVDVS